MKLNPPNTMIEMLQRAAAHPWVYDQIQILAGQKQSLEKLCRHTAGIPAETVLDVGGGTGTFRRLWPQKCRYVCLDMEMPKLRGFRSKCPDGLAILSDATRMPLAAGVADVVMCIAIMHHLTDEMVDQVLEEVLRVLRVGGHLVFLDPVLNPRRWVGRMLWRLDRGSYPRTAEGLRGKLDARFRVTRWEQYSIYHEYVFAIGVRT